MTTEFHNLKIRQWQSKKIGFACDIFCSFDYNHTLTQTTLNFFRLFYFKTVPNWPRCLSSQFCSKLKAILRKIFIFHGKIFQFCHLVHLFHFSSRFVFCWSTARNGSTTKSSSTLDKSGVNDVSIFTSNLAKDWL